MSGKGAPRARPGPLLGRMARRKPNASSTSAALDGTPLQSAIRRLVQPLKLFRRHSEIQPNQMGSVNFLL
jgi:hypothetical protein